MFKKEYIAYDDKLPTIRITKIELDDFKSVAHGEVVMNCGRKPVTRGTEADILGIYGQNGSGKTAVTEALAVLKYSMMGMDIPDHYSECIAEGSEFAQLVFTFDFQYRCEDEGQKTVTYSFKISRIPNDTFENLTSPSDGATINRFPYKVKIFDESIAVSGLMNGSVQKKQDILTTRSEDYPIGPTRKIEAFVGKNKDQVRIDLEVNKRTAAKGSQSFIFMEETMDIFQKYSSYSDSFNIIAALNLYASSYLYVIDNRLYPHVHSFILLLYTRAGVLPFKFLGKSKIPSALFEELQRVTTRINTVLPSLITGMKLEIKSTDFLSADENGKEVEFYSRRADKLIPLRDESSGVIKLVSILHLLISVFYEESVTVAIDELDAGIYEYLLGEILEGIQAYGKGQFIFTSHNLRPLEVLKKECIIFTTANRENRYIRLKGVGRTNNLRDLYLREILGLSQDEKLYDGAKRQRMIASFMKAGSEDEKERQ